MKSSTLWLMAGSATVALLAATPALAQQPAPAAADNAEQGTVVEQVIVTTERRATNVQDTPLAVTAFTDKARENLGITTIQSLAQFSPGVSYSAAADRPTIRGVGRFNNSHGLNSPVAQYVDGIYVSTVQDASRRPIFVDRIEVVSGPQGSLAGKGSAAGAIYTYLKRPKDYFQVEVGGLAGNYERWGLEGSITGPITDWLKYRVNMARYKQEKGFFNNLEDGSTEGDRFGNRTLLDIMFSGNVGDKIDFFFKGSTVDYDESLRDTASFAPFTTGATNPCYQVPYISPQLTPNNAWGLFAPGSATSCGAFASGSGATAVPGFPQATIYGAGITTNPVATTGNLRDFVSNYQSDLHIAGYYNLTFDTTYHAPWMDIKYIVGRSRYHYTQSSDNDGSPVQTMLIPGGTPNAGQAAWNPLEASFGPGARTVFTGARQVNANGVNRYEEEPSWYSNEITFTSTWKGPLQGIVGLYQYNQYTKQPTATITYEGFSELATPWYSPVFQGATMVLPAMRAPDNLLGNAAQRGNQLTRQNTWAAFTQWDYKFNDKWTLTAGLRYNYDKENAYEEARDIANNPAVGGGANNIQTILLGTNFAATGQVINGPFSTDVSGAFFPGFAVISPSATTGQLPILPKGYRYIDPASVGTVIANNAACTSAMGVNYLYLRQPICGNQRIQVGPGVTGLAIDQYGNRIRTEEAEWKQTTGGFSLSYKPNEDSLYYIRYAKGYRPGGFGATTAGFLPLNPYADKETLDSYEVGAKITLGGRLVLNGDVFMYDYKNIQQQLSRFERCLDANDISTCTAVSSVINLPSAVNQGFELTSQWYATPDLQFVLNYGYLDAHIKNGLTDDFGFQDTNDPAALLPTAKKFKAIVNAAGAPVLDAVTGKPTYTQDPSGNDLPNSPHHKIAANANYTFHMAPGNLTASVSYIWRSEAFSQGDLFMEEVSKVKAYSQTDARLVFRQKDGDYQIILYGTNIFNQDTYESGGAIRRGTGPLTGVQDQVYYRTETLLPPRAYGIEFLKRFR